MPIIRPICLPTSKSPIPISRNCGSMSSKNASARYVAAAVPCTSPSSRSITIASTAAIMSNRPSTLSATAPSIYQCGWRARATPAAYSAATSPRAHQGYIVDADLVNSVEPGVDNRASVLQTLGKPSFASQFNTGDWYYIARDSRNLAYLTPIPKSQLTLKISFNDQGVVQSITRTGIDRVASISPYDKTTPTLGRKRSFFEELFGNIGQVGAPGSATGGGGDDSQP